MDMRNKNGFTLVELLVVILVFSILIGAVLNLLSTSIKSQTIILREQKVAAEVSYAVEYMSRTIRMAIRDNENNCLLYDGDDIYNYRLMDSEGDYGSHIRFLSYKKECQEFYFQDGVIYERRSGGENYKPEAPAVEMTSSGTVVEQLYFHKAESDWMVRSEKQPRVMINVKAAPMGVGSSLRIQTITSQRNINIPREVD